MLEMEDVLIYLHEHNYLNDGEIKDTDFLLLDKGYMIDDTFIKANIWIFNLAIIKKYPEKFTEDKALEHISKWLMELLHHFEIDKIQILFFINNHGVVFWKNSSYNFILPPTLPKYSVTLSTTSNGQTKHISLVLRLDGYITTAAANK